MGRGRWRRDAVSEGPGGLSTEGNGKAGLLAVKPGGALAAILEGLLPRRCVLCGGAAVERASAVPAALCLACLEDLPRNAGACRLCALPARNLADGRCGGCQGARRPWDRVLAPLRYEWPVDVLVQQLKFQRQTVAGAALAQAMLARRERASNDRSSPRAAAPLLIPVPLHWSRTLVRGYNQAMELALHLSRATGWRLDHRHLRRRRRTRAQTRLDASARRHNLRGAFRWRGPSLAGMTIVLVDDVMTTGSTLAACSRVLRRAGAERVEAWVAARAADRSRIRAA